MTVGIGIYLAGCLTGLILGLKAHSVIDKREYKKALKGDKDK